MTNYAAFIEGRWFFSDAPFTGYDNTVFQIEDGRLYILRRGGIEAVQFEPAEEEA